MAKEDPYLVGRRIRRRMVEIAEDSEQMVRDITYWNGLKRGVPIDCGRDRVRASIAREIIHLIDSEQHIPMELYDRLEETC